MEAPRNNELKPCRICVDFYGTADTDYLCSKCLREQKKSEPVQPAATTQSHLSPIRQVPEQVAAQLSAQPSPINFEEEKKQDVVMAEPAAVETAPAQVAVAASAAEETASQEQPKVQTNKNKCWECNKKVGLVQVPCQCSFVYCAKHRHAESHNCTFDYLAQQRERLTKLNPQIIHEKMEKMF